MGHLRAMLHRPLTLKQSHLFLLLVAIGPCAVFYLTDPFIGVFLSPGVLVLAGAAFTACSSGLVDCLAVYERLPDWVFASAVILVPALVIAINYLLLLALAWAVARVRLLSR